MITPERSTVVRLLTPPAAGAIAVLSICGPRATAWMARLTGIETPFDKLKTYLVRLQDGQESLDEGLLIRRSTDSYEIHTHGGKAVVEALLLAFSRWDIHTIATTHDPSSLHWCHDDRAESLIGQEALEALPSANSQSAVRLLLAQQEAGLTRWAMANMEYLKKFSPDAASHEALWQIATETQWLLTRSFTLRQLFIPPRVAILGPPNAGKSTLANALIGRPTSITSEQPGTTRDWVDTSASIGDPRSDSANIGIMLVDTAGVRETDDPIESESIARTYQQAGHADMIVFVVDGREPLSVQTTTWLTSLAAPQTRRYRPLILAINKSDLSPPHATIESAGIFASVHISALHHHGLDALQRHMIASLELQPFDASEPMVFTERQRLILKSVMHTCSTQAAMANLATLLNQQHQER